MASSTSVILAYEFTKSSYVRMADHQHGLAVFRHAGRLTRNYPPRIGKQTQCTLLSIETVLAWILVVVKLLKVQLNLKVWCATLCEPAYQQEGSQSSVLCSLALRAKTICHLLPMRGPFISPIPLGENSLATCYIAAVRQSVVCCSVPLNTYLLYLFQKCMFIIVCCGRLNSVSLCATA